MDAARSFEQERDGRPLRENFAGRCESEPLSGVSFRATRGIATKCSATLGKSNRGGGTEFCSWIGCWLREIQARQAFGSLTPGNHVKQFEGFGKAEMSEAVVISKEFYRRGKEVSGFWFLVSGFSLPNVFAETLPRTRAEAWRDALGAVGANQKPEARNPSFRVPKKYGKKARSRARARLEKWVGLRR